MQAVVIEQDRKAPPPAPAPITVSVVNPLADGRWDEGAGAFAGATVFHSAGWARVLAETYGYRPQYLVAHRDHGVAGILPVMEVRSPLTGTRGVALPFTDFCPPLARDPETRRALLAKALERCQDRHWKHLDLRDFPADDPGAPFSPFLEHTLRLSPDPAAQFAGCRPDARRAIRRAEREDLAAETATSIDAIREYYRLHCLTRRRHGLPVQPFAFFHNIHQHLLAEGHGFVVLVRADGQPIAGAVFLAFGSHALYKFGASDPARLDLRGNHLAMWHGIRACAETGGSALSLGKTSPDQDGLRQFKSSFGTTEHPRPYRRWDARTAGWIAPEDQRTGWHNRLFRIAPLPALRLAGRILYPHVG